MISGRSASTLYTRPQVIGVNDGTCCTQSNADTAICGFEIQGSVCVLFVGEGCRISYQQRRKLQLGTTPDQTANPDQVYLKDQVDTDSDGDGKPDAEEGAADADSDGIPDAKKSNTADTDGDGLA